MPTWGKILAEIQKEIKNNNPAAFDTVRNKYLKELTEKTHRNTIIYAARWTTGDVPANIISITDEDLQAFMEAIHGLKGDKLDLILHTGGGSAEATDAIVTYIRQKFIDIRVIIPQAAMSAGTMLALAADEMIMGKHSFIGPIDPQFILNTPVGVQAVPAQAIMEQFKKAQKDCADNPKNLSSWLPMLSQYGPALLVQCQNQIDFGRDLVKTWLGNYMFKGEDGKKAEEISEFLSNHGNFKTHGKHISINQAKAIGLKIVDLERDQDLQEKVLSVFHATMHTLNTTAVKVICNQNGNAFIKQFQIQLPIKRP
ncbi:MAG: serine protease [Ignavibacteria bacterium]|nr:serine protease [Ignavibacteria bacterium]